MGAAPARVCARLEAWDGGVCKGDRPGRNRRGWGGRRAARLGRRCWVGRPAAIEKGRHRGTQPQPPSTPVARPCNQRPVSNAGFFLPTGQVTSLAALSSPARPTRRHVHLTGQKRSPPSTSRGVVGYFLVRTWKEALARFEIVSKPFTKQESTVTALPSALEENAGAGGRDGVRAGSCADSHYGSSCRPATPAINTTRYAGGQHAEPEHVFDKTPVRKNQVDESVSAAARATASASEHNKLCNNLSAEAPFKTRPRGYGVLLPELPVSCNHRLLGTGTAARLARSGGHGAARQTTSPSRRSFILPPQFVGILQWLVSISCGIKPHTTKELKIAIKATKKLCNVMLDTVGCSCKW